MLWGKHVALLFLVSGPWLLGAATAMITLEAPQELTQKRQYLDAINTHDYGLDSLWQDVNTNPFNSDSISASPDQRTRTDAYNHGGIIILAANSNQISPVLDAESIRCLHCHLGGGNAPSLNVDTIEQLLLGVVYGNHPVGIDYTSASLTGAFRDISELNNLIVLPEGRIGCISCHVAFSMNHGDLVIRNVGSSLCMECHNL